MEEELKKIKYQKLQEYKDLVPAFKEFYYAEKNKDFKTTFKDIVNRFNEEVCYPKNRVFNPYPNACRSWEVKWDRDILQKPKGSDLLPIESQPEQLIASRDADNKIIFGAPKDEDLEAGTRTLAGELTNDALQMLRDDQALEEIYTGEELIKRRNYIINVFSHVTKLVHGKASLMLKASQEKRENAGFLMNLLAKASAGKMTEEELGLLETTYKPQQQNAQPTQS